MKQELPALKPAEVVTALTRAGFTVRRQTGSHLILHKSGLARPVTVPMHSGDLPTGTLRAIIRQADLTIDRFLKLL